MQCNIHSPNYQGRWHVTDILIPITCLTHQSKETECTLHILLCTVTSMRSKTHVKCSILTMVTPKIISYKSHNYTLNILLPTTFTPNKRKYSHREILMRLWDAWPRQFHGSPQVILLLAQDSHTGHLQWINFTVLPRAKHTTHKFTESFLQVAITRQLQVCLHRLCCQRVAPECQAFIICTEFKAETQWLNQILKILCFNDQKTWNHAWHQQASQKSTLHEQSPAT